MSRTTRTIWPITAVLVLAAIGTASAECAWVLWYEERGWISAGLPLSPSEAFETESRCEARIAKRVADTQRFVADLNHGAGSAQRFRQTIVGGGATVTITTTDAGDGSAWKIDMRCLPDTVDPRGLSARRQDETNK
jgi:hypothetical protein